MAARRPRLSAALLAGLGLGAVAPAGAQDATRTGADAAAAGWRQVVTRAEIERAGVMRLGEVMRLARRWDVVTVDEYTWRAAAGALEPLQDDGWAVMLDGHELEPALLGVLALERLPVDPGALDSVVFTAAPVLAAGALRGRGLVELYTSRPRPGPSARARYATGSETGDPGPFAFLPGAVPNRDRFGHDAALGLAYGGRRWHVAAGLGLGVHVATDPAIAARLAATGRFPRIERTAPSLRAGFSSAAGAHEALAGRSTLDDWIRIEAYGAEIPIRSTLDHAAAGGWIGVGGSRLSYRTGYERSQLASTLGPLLAMEHRVARAELAVSRGGVDRARRAGMALVHRDTRVAGGLGDPTTLELRTFGALAWRPGSAHGQELALSAGVAGGELIGGAALIHRWRAGRFDDLVLLLAVDLPSPAGTGLWSLAQRGDPWLGNAGVVSSIDSGAPRARQASVDLGWAHHVSPRLSLSGGLFYRAFRSGFLARRELGFDTDLLAWRGPVEVVAGRAGQVGGISAGAELAVGSKASVSAWYRARAVLSGGGAVRAAWSAHPVHAGGLDLRYAPARGFELTGQARVRGAIDRAEYAGTGPLAAAGARTGAAVTADLGAHKWLWGRRVRAGLVARNIFDARDVTHPEGGGTSRAFVLTAEAMVP